MPLYEYTAKTLSGDVINGSYEAKNKEELKKALSAKGYYISDLSKVSHQNVRNIFERVSAKDIAVFSRQLGVLLSSGIGIVESLGILREQTDKKVFYKVLDKVFEDLQTGKILSEAFDERPDIFPDFFRSMIKVGENSGNLEEILETLAEYYDKEVKIIRKARTALTYPSVLIGISILVVIILVGFVLPVFTDMLVDFGGTLPAVTRVLLGVSTFISKNIFFLILVSIGTYYALLLYFRTYDGKRKFDRMKLEMPLVGKSIRKLITSRFARSLGILLKSGMPIIESLEITSDLMGNAIVQDALVDSVVKVKKGYGLSEPIERTGVFPPLLTHMLRVGEETGSLDEILLKTSTFFDEELEESLEKMVSLIEPIIILIMAVVIGFVLLSVLLPMINIMEVIN